jgi:hypothetical protein
MEGCGGDARCVSHLCLSASPVTVEIHETAFRIAEKHRCNIYDALVIAAALEAGCAILYSDDLQDAQTPQHLIDDALVVPSACAFDLISEPTKISSSRRMVMRVLPFGTVTTAPRLALLKSYSRFMRCSSY